MDEADRETTTRHEDKPENSGLSGFEDKPEISEVSGFRVIVIVLVVIVACLGGFFAYEKSCTGEWDLDCPEYQEAMEELEEEDIEDPVADPRYPDYGNEDIDVTGYGLDLKYDPKTATLSGRAELSIRPVRDGEELVLDFSDAMNVKRLRVGDDTAEFRQHGHKLTIDTPLSKSDNVKVEVDYAGTPTSVADPLDRKDHKGRVGTVIDEETGALRVYDQPYGAFTWYPVNELGSDDATFDLEITVPDGYAAVGSGVGGKPGDNTYSWGDDDPSDNGNALAIDKFETWKVGDENDTRVWMPSDEKEWKTALERIPEIRAFLDETFDPESELNFPVTNEVILVNGKATMDVAGKTVLPADAAESDAEREAKLVHAMARQVFATPIEWDTHSKDAWLHAGPAGYAETLWRAEQGEFTLAEAKAELEKQDAEARDKYGPPGDPDSDAAVDSANMSACPTLMFIDLGDALGSRDKVNELLGRWIAGQDYEYSRDGFIMFAEGEDRDVSKFFNTWLDATTTPKTRLPRRAMTTNVDNRGRSTFLAHLSSTSPESSLALISCGEAAVAGDRAGEAGKSLSRNGTTAVTSFGEVPML